MSTRKPGPKTDVDVARVTLSLDEMTRRRLRVLGKGNESAGARLAARVAYDRYQRVEEAREPTGEAPT
jgi:urease accessory protein UreE